MLAIQPGTGPLGATVGGADLRKPVSDSDFACLLQALGQFGVLRFPAQDLQAADLRRFSARFGGLEVLSANGRGEPGMPEVSILSNIVRDGAPIGIPDAGQDWHTDMTYNRTVGFVNVLYALEVPMRDGHALGATEFANTQLAYEDLPEDFKQRFAQATATHDFNQFHEHMRRNRGSKRMPLSEEQKRERPPVSHPLFLTHPITGRKVIYANPGFTSHIDGLPAKESEGILAYLFEHVLQPRYRHVHDWTRGDVLMWDHLGTWHYARPDYGPDEHRLIKRCQVLADSIFNPAFVAAGLRPLGGPVAASH
ncbi:MAG: TauD/TfdA dioxygenase family protein [Burkholderiaceae bacterium]